MVANETEAAWRWSNGSCERAGTPDLEVKTTEDEPVPRGLQERRLGQVVVPSRLEHIDAAGAGTRKVSLVAPPV